VGRSARSVTETLEGWHEYRSPAPQHTISSPSPKRRQQQDPIQVGKHLPSCATKPMRAPPQPKRQLITSTPVPMPEAISHHALAPYLTQGQRTSRRAHRRPQHL